MLRHSLRQEIAEPLEAESLVLTLVQRALGPRTTHAAGASVGRQRLGGPGEAGAGERSGAALDAGGDRGGGAGSPVYLTQVFQQVEGMPLYRYQLRLRLARALDLLGRYDDLTCSEPGTGLLQPQPFQRSVPRGVRTNALGIQAVRAGPIDAAIAKDSDSGAARFSGLLRSARIAGQEEKAMSEKTCAACDCALEGTDQGQDWRQDRGSLLRRMRTEVERSAALRRRIGEERMTMQVPLRRRNTR